VQQTSMNARVSLARRLRSSSMHRGIPRTSRREKVKVEAERADAYGYNSEGTICEWS
jgi:hypothetical protein